MPRRTAVIVLAAVLAGCASAPRSADGVRLRVLGTAQDGGLPHAACTCERCERARRDPAAARLVSALALIVDRPGGGAGVYLVDATPDIRAQLDMLADVRQAEPGRVDRSPVDGVFLTHAHIGHYLGLAMFGFEAVHTRSLPVWCSPSMAAFLRNNGPWSQLVSIGNIEVREVTPGEPVLVEDRVRVEAIPVPHRAEFTDTMAYLLDAGGPTVLYVPDTEPWRSWDVGVLDVVRARGVDVLIVDGTFYWAGELPGRPVESIGHPLMVDTMDLLGEEVGSGRLRVVFTHFNHSNPVLDGAGPEAREVRSRGFEIASDGQEIRLDPHVPARQRE